jgi:RNA polymerase sigma-70 factor (ECF subfamily)
MNGKYFFITPNIISYLKGFQKIFSSCCNFSDGTNDLLLTMTINDYNFCVSHHADHLFRFILKHTQQEEDARDVVQNAFEILWKKRDEVDAEKAKSFLFSVAYKNRIDQFRKQKKVNLVDEFPAQTKIVNEHKSGLKEALDKALNTLPEVQKSCILLRDYEGYDYKEIGEILSLNESQVKVYIFRARQTLKNYLVSIETVL